MQRASRFTTLPIRYAVPLMGCSAALHWLCSQSFFMVHIDGVDAHGDVDESDQLVRLGYSATGVVAPIGVSVGGMVATVCTAVFRHARTPLGETSMSVVLSAACHGSRYEAEPWLREVQWGMLRRMGKKEWLGIARFRRVWWSDRLLGDCIDDLSTGRLVMASSNRLRIVVLRICHSRDPLYV
jgi:hypothetical protein